MIGMWSARENARRLERVEAQLRRGDLRPEEREDLEQLAAELRRWLLDVWLVSGGGASG